jgi:hypothetical protein
MHVNALQAGKSFQREWQLEQKGVEFRGSRQVPILFRTGVFSKRRKVNLADVSLCMMHISLLFPLHAMRGGKEKSARLCAWVSLANGCFCEETELRDAEPRVQKRPRPGVKSKANLTAMTM